MADDFDTVFANSVLIVDDSDADNFLNRLLLERENAARTITDFSYASDALSFLEQADRPAIDLILIDVNMPRMDGFEFADAFEQLQPERRGDTAVIMASGSLNPGDQARARAHPAIDGYLVKPIDIDAIRKIMAER